MPENYEYIFRQLFKQVNGNKKKKFKKAKWQYPLSAERNYLKQLKEKVGSPLIDKINSRLTEETLKRWFDNNRADAIRIDDWTEEFEEVTSEMREEVEKIAGEEKQSTDSAWLILAAIFSAVYLFNKKQFDNVTTSVLGFPFQKQDYWKEAMQKAWAAENYNLIKNLSDDYIKKINNIVWDGYRTGLSAKEIAKQIKELNQEMFGDRYKIDPKTGKRIKVMSRAEKIARDQTGKLNSLLMQKHMQDIGADVYEWNTAMDERVRGRPGGRYPKAKPSHWAMNGKLFKWSNQNVYAEKSDPNTWKPRSGNMSFSIPGMEILCRCWASVYWENFNE